MFELNHIYIAGLVKKAQQKDNDAFAELYAMTYQKQYQYSKNYLKDEYLAQDALQEVYILALKNLHKLQEPRVFVAWLKQINFRVCYNMMQKRRSYTADNLEIVPETAFLRQNLDDYNPETTFLREAESDRLRQALKQLPEQEQKAIYLRYNREMKLEDAARELNVSLSTVKRLIHRACIHLQEILEKEA